MFPPRTRRQKITLAAAGIVLYWLAAMISRSPAPVSMEDILSGEALRGWSGAWVGPVRTIRATGPDKGVAPLMRLELEMSGSRLHGQAVLEEPNGDRLVWSTERGPERGEIRMLIRESGRILQLRGRLDRGTLICWGTGPGSERVIWRERLEKDVLSLDIVRAGAHELQVVSAVLERE